MAMTRYFHRNPWRELDQITNRLTQMFENNTSSMPASSGVWAPAVSVEETSDELVLTAELPGVRSEDVDVQLESAWGLQFLGHDFLRDARIGWAPTTRR